MRIALHAVKVIEIVIQAVVPFGVEIIQPAGDGTVRVGNNIERRFMEAREQAGISPESAAPNAAATPLFMNSRRFQDLLIVRSPHKDSECHQTKHDKPKENPA